MRCYLPSRHQTVTMSTIICAPHTVQECLSNSIAKFPQINTSIIFMWEVFMLLAFYMVASHVLIWTVNPQSPIINHLLAWIPRWCSHKTLRRRRGGKCGRRAETAACSHRFSSGGGSSGWTGGRARWPRTRQRPTPLLGAKSKTSLPNLSLSSCVLNCTNRVTTQDLSIIICNTNANKCGIIC